ncbi:MAG: FliM/FliN family flagellar motor switch protein, partial [Planctomycetes bacterium]|nr:FliM/FliN family flagellar motor switch protein [Planctomycetota bacterium]
MADERDPTNNHAAGGPPPVGSSDAERLLQQAQWALESIDARSTPGSTSDSAAFEYEELVGQPASGEDATLDVLSDVQLDLKIELGRADMHLEDVLKLRKGSVVPLDKLVSDPVDIYVN